VKRHTLRGKLEASELRRLVVDDGRLTHGLRIHEFHVWPAIEGGTQLTTVTVGTKSNMAANMDAGDNRQIAWGLTHYSASSGQLGQGSTSIIDHDKTVVQDLFIRNDNTSDAVNYLLVLDAVELTETESVLNLIKERAQDDIK
jgi:hypothetical protein